MRNLLILFLLYPTLLFSQGWEKAFGGIYDEMGLSVQQTSDGGYIITGEQSSNGSSTSKDVYLIKTDNNGDAIWTKTYGGFTSDYGKSVQQTTDEGYIITGTTGSFGNLGWNVYLIKTDTNGDTIWTKTYGGDEWDYGYSVQQTIDGGYIVVGSTGDPGSKDAYLIKTDNNGDTLWTKTFGGPSDDSGWSVQQTSDSGYIITGRTASIMNGDDVCLIKTNNIGDTLWTKSFGGLNDDYGMSVQQTVDGGYIITGETDSYGLGLGDVYLIKTDSQGETLWTKTFGGTDTDFGFSGQQTTDGGYIVCGYTGGLGMVTSDLYLVKTDTNGDSLWTRTYGGTNYDDYGTSVRQTNDGGYIITGYTKSFGSGMKDVYLIKTNEDGNVMFISEISTPIPNRKLIKSVDFLGREIITPIKNKPYIEIYDDGSSKKKVILE